MSMVSSQQDDEVMAEINITPFTDVLLVLLIIFMILAALVAPPGFEKQLPDKNDTNQPIQQQKKTDNIEVLVNEKGRVFIDGKATDDQHIYADMAEVHQRKGDKHVSLTADVKAPYGTIIRILDAAKLSGLEDVGFVTS
jgi:biopolymer transport protein TolR